MTRQDRRYPIPPSRRLERSDMRVLRRNDLAQIQTWQPERRAMRCVAQGFPKKHNSARVDAPPSLPAPPGSTL
ncbi:hypothetical protein KOW79_003048 [Hemibagrus wyckioides]|uniref:Uncharacterized protein n=1 Tax=Hemibagrus wyckioides TaxID=337641 RepID=A0A9D3SVM2_9TELE|nr:hypothetical protein KOW79_003048 [Hemibagrus wyckioides]